MIFPPSTKQTYFITYVSKNFDFLSNYSGVAISFMHDWEYHIPRIAGWSSYNSLTPFWNMANLGYQPQTNIMVFLTSIWINIYIYRYICLSKYFNIKLYVYIIICKQYVSIQPLFWQKQYVIRNQVLLNKKNINCEVRTGRNYKQDDLGVPSFQETSNSMKMNDTKFNGWKKNLKFSSHWQWKVSIAIWIIHIRILISGCEIDDALQWIETYPFPIPLYWLVNRDPY